MVDSPSRASDESSLSLSLSISVSKDLHPSCLQTAGGSDLTRNKSIPQLWDLAE